MRIEDILAELRRCGDSPESAPHLRRFIYRLAVQGRLSRPEVGDAPVSDLLGQMDDARSAFDPKASRRRSPTKHAVRSQVLPYEVPDHWAAVPLSRVGSFSGGMTPTMGRADYWDGDIPWFSAKDVKFDELTESAMQVTRTAVEKTRLQMHQPGSLVLVARSGILKRTLPVALLRIPATVNQDLKVLQPFVPGMDRFLQIMLRGMTDHILSALVKTGTTVQSLKYKEFESQPFPLPPLAEQHRIVAQVDELLSLCEELAEAQIQRESSRDALRSGALRRLTTATSRQRDVQFLLGHTRRLLKKPDHIASVRKTILDLAVRGRLMPQQARAHPATRRKGADQRDWASGSVLGPGTAAAPAPFPVPTGWTWRALKDICESIVDGDHQPPPQSDEGVPFLVIGNVRKRPMDYASARRVPRDYYAKLDSAHRPVVGDVLYTLVGATLGEPILVTDPQPFVVQRHIGIIRPSKEVDTHYLLTALQSAFVYDQATACATGTGQKTVPLAGLRAMRIPLPPLPQQRRIVAKVQALMAVCDQLEIALEVFDRERARLLDSLVRSALDGGAERAVVGSLASGLH